MKKAAAVLSAVLMLVTAVFAGFAMAAETEDLSGEWYLYTMIQGDTEMDAGALSSLGMSMILTLSEDGTASMAMDMIGQYQEGTWSAEEGTITFEGSSVPYKLEDGLLILQNEEYRMEFSNTPPAAADATLAPAVTDPELSDFNGDWNAATYVFMGMPIPLNITGIEIAININDGKIVLSEVQKDISNDLEVVDTLEAEFDAELQEDGTLYVDFGEEDILGKLGMGEASGIYLTLHEDGRISGSVPEFTEAMQALAQLAAEQETAEGDEADTGDSEGSSGEITYDLYLIIEKAE